MLRKLLEKCSPRPRRRWLAEPLESRLLLSADILPAADALQIIGTEAADSALIRTVESETGETAQLFVVLNGASFEYTIAAGQKILIDLLDGNDKLDAQITVDAEWDIELGEGDDQIFIEALIGDLSANQHYRVRGGEGDNSAGIKFGDGVHGRRLPPAETNIVAEYRFGGGDDNVSFDWQVQLERPLHLTVAFDLGAGNDNSTMSYGGGSGGGKVDVHDINFKSGLGDDALKIALAGVFGEVELTADAGEGNDTVQSNIHATWLTVGNFDVSGGDGDDVIDLCAEVRVEPEPVPPALASKLNVDTGEGNDKVKVKWFDNVPTDHFELDLRVGQAESFLPEVGDEVLLAFEGGDISAPIIIGTLWNGADQPPETEGEAPSRKFHIGVDTALPAVQSEAAIELGNQKDDLALKFGGALGDLHVETMLGGGNDTATLRIDTTESSRVEQNVKVDVNAGLGGDSVDVDATGVFKNFHLGVDLGADPENDALPLESLTLNYADFEIEYKAQGEHGYRSSGDEECGSAEYGWDVSKGEDGVQAAYTVDTSGGETEDSVEISVGGSESEGSLVTVSRDERTASVGRNETITVHSNRTESVFNDIQVAMQSKKNKSASNSINVNLTGAARIDEASNLIRFSQDTRRTAEGGVSQIGIMTGSGDDLVAMILGSDGLEPLQTVMAMDLDLGGGADTVRVDTSDLDGLTRGAFSEVSGLGYEITVAEYRDGGEPGGLDLHVDLKDLESLIVKTGDRADEFLVDLDHPQTQVPELKVFTRGGNDTVAASFVGVLSEVVFNVDTGDGGDTVDVNVIESDTIVTGAGTGAGPHVKAFSGATTAETLSFFAYAPSFTGGVRVATGDINGDGVADIITGAGPGAGPHVRVFDGRDNSELRSFFAYGPSFTGGVFVAAGDINGDGVDDIITGAGSGAGPHVKVFDGVSGAEVRSFFAYAPTFVGGVRVAAGDVNGDGRADIITATGPGAGPHVKVFDGVSGAEIRSFFAYDANFRGGVFVAAGDFNGDNVADIVTGTDTGGAPLVKVFNGTNLAALKSFSAYAPNFVGGVRVAVGDVNGDGRDDIITGAGPGAGPHVKAFDGQSGGLLRSFFAYDPNFTGGVFVAANDVGQAGEFDLNVDAGAGNDHLAMEFVTGSPRVDLIGVDMGTGADNVELIWKGALQDPSAELRLQVLLDLGGRDPYQSGDGDVVQTTFIGGDPDRPFISGFIWNSEDSGTSDHKSLSIEMTSTDGILEASNQMTGGNGADSMQLYFQGKLKVTGDQFITVVDLGGGDDEMVLGTTELESEGSLKAEPIAIDVEGGAGEDKLIVNGSNRADEIAVTDLSVIVYGSRVVQYSGFECLEVNALGGDDTVTMTSINPRTNTELDGGPGRDRFIGRFDGDFVGDLTLKNFEQISIKVRGRTIGSITSDSAALLRFNEEEA
jgi:hypothetical protein